MTSQRRPLLLGAATGGGVFAWVLGYTVTYALVAGRIRESVPTQLLEVIEDGSLVTEFVGWVFFNAHFVPTVQEVPVLGASVTSYVGADGFTPVLYLVPVGLLVVAGLAVARLYGAADPMTGALVGTLITPGYLLVTLVGRALVSVDISTALGSVTGAPELVPVLVVGGLVYPVVCGAIGGLLGARLAE